jgi:hypothetical protein
VVAAPEVASLPKALRQSPCTDHLPGIQMTTQHPITPPFELVEDWIELAKPLPQRPPNPGELATLAARWGADQELEACCEWLRCQNLVTHCALIPSLRAARRPKPPSLKEQALGALYAIATGADDTREFHQDLETIKQALESLPE